jgi:glycyl-tRNA synthetase beta chain
MHYNVKNLDKHNKYFTKIIDPTVSITSNDPEVVLTALVDEVEINIEKLIQERRWFDAVDEVMRLIEPTDNFLKKLLVNHPDPKIKQARVFLINTVKNTFQKIADWERISTR